MKITLVSTFENLGGASIAAVRLHKSLLSRGIESRMLVHIPSQNNEKVFPLSNHLFQKNISFLRFSLDRLLFIPFAKNKSVRFAFSAANIGLDISDHPLIKNADIIHLHWINFGFLSLKSLQKLFALKKPILWTFHDMWAATGGCHSSKGCKNYLTHCHNCPLLAHPSNQDLSWKVFERKINVFQNKPFSIVTCSNWLNSVIKSSALLGNFSIQTIHNPIDLIFFQSIKKSDARKNLNLSENKKLILYGAANASDPGKGFIYLQKALNILKNENKKELSEIELVIFGKADEVNVSEFPIKVTLLGKLSPKELINAYSACDIIALPYVEDNLPNIASEALACNLPVVAFKAGGLPDMVDHMENGYLAEAFSIEDLYNGLITILYAGNYEEIQLAARRKAEMAFSENLNTEKYIKVYQNLLIKSE